MLAILSAALLFFAPAPRQIESEFMRLFEQARSINDKESMKQLVMKHHDEAAAAAVEICQRISQKTSEELEDRIAALAAAWRKAYHSEFVDRMYAFYSLKLKGTFKRSHSDLMKRFRKMQPTLQEAKEQRNGPKLTQLGNDYLGMGAAFEKLGDLYMAAICYRNGGDCFDETYRGKNADFRTACKAWGDFIRVSDQLQLEGVLYKQVKVRFNELEYQGYGDPSKGPEARAKAKAEADPAYAPHPIHARFEVVPAIDTYDRPHYTADAIYQMWPQIYLQAKGSRAPIPTLDASELQVIRTGAAKAQVDVDGDGEGDLGIPLGGKIEAVPLRLGSGDGARPWAFLATVGQQQDTYQGFRFNLAPADAAMPIYFAGAGSLVGEVDGTPLRLIDDNCDGRYGSPPRTWAYIGVRDGSFQPDVDSLIVGTTSTAVPWSEKVRIGELWYRLQPSEAGDDLLISRVDLETGTLQLSTKGLKPDWVLVQGTGDLEGCVYRIEKKGTPVPAGTYHLLCGKVSKGKRQQMMKALMLPTSQTRTWTVSAGSTQKIELGAPYSFDFSVTQDDSTVTVEGPSVVVVGRGGESYQRFWNCVPAPQVFVRRKGTKKGKDAAHMRPAGSQEELDALGDYRAAWFPITANFEKKKRGEDLEVRLYEKKNRLFGKIDSDWKD